MEEEHRELRYDGRGGHWRDIVIAAAVICEVLGGDDAHEGAEAVTVAGSGSEDGTRGADGRIILAYTAG